jgi:SAM-dependent methyltransferase
MTNTAIDFGYPFWLSYGHLLLAGLFGTALAATVWFGVPAWFRVGLIVVTGWALISAAVVTFGLGVTRVPVLPTPAFLPDDRGHVLDVGAGTGRSSIMVLRERPHVTLVASDLFSESFDRHFGSEGQPQDRLRRNLAAAGVAVRATIETADMLALPFADETFDGVVSAYAMEHVGREGSRRAVSEAYRVLRPGGQFLLMVVHDDWWTRLAFGPLLMHGNLPRADWWADAGREARFAIAGSGTRPGTLWLLFENGW